MMEPDYVYEDCPETPEYQCFDCEWTWSPQGYWDYEDGESFVPSSHLCPACGSVDTDECYGGGE